MATYVLIHGASDAFYWHRVVPLLQDRGHEVVAPDLPIGDGDAGFADYADAVVSAIGHRSDLVVVGQSMGAFTAPIVCQRVPVELLILVAPMIPAPGETPGDWWGNTGQPQAQRELDEREGRDPDGAFDVVTTFLHDVPDEVVAAVLDHGVPGQSENIFAQPWPLEQWPGVPTRVLIARGDRLFPLDFARRLTKERLGITPDEIPGGHLVAFGHPDSLVDWLESYRVEILG
ncbi:MAG: alpha/beta fold hydrolase [Actinophytocola sp.]|uniref:alpha/beta fold hydrolase n=1 Tax=Actinophytocola sp. TaxID=1872138 RepID=UPI00132674C6|nr:alpha/beta hydrolase [Actinophytocola sp.]MPZ81634.1 alpha/beta fold hydrolase [Actinophytocola sp.]